MLMRTVRVVLAMCVSGMVLATAAHANDAGVTWTSQVSAADNSWQSVIWGGTTGQEKFVAVSSDGSNRVMTSPDGITWTSQTSATNYSWRSVTWGNGLFVAVSNTGGTVDRVMTSPDGITWTSRTSAADDSWQSVTYGNGLFVAVSSMGGAGERVMTSPDGITWTARTSPGNNVWQSVTYGNGLFVAVSRTGSGNRVMTSGNGFSYDPVNLPAPLVQQLGRPASGTCESVAPESLNWSGVASGGWSESWAEWVNNGKGGAVCTRTLVYSAAQSRWIVG